MKKSVFIFLALLLHASNSNGIRFHSYINEQGETVFSNVPQNCIKNASLTCLEYHPVFSGKATPPTSPIKSKRETSQSAQQPVRSRIDRSSYNNLIEHLEDSQSGLQLDILNRVVEMNNLINEYFPGNPDPAATNDVYRQQQNILEVLQVIKHAADKDEKPTIDRAINILRSNLVQ